MRPSPTLATQGWGTRADKASVPQPCYARMGHPRGQSVRPPPLLRKDGAPALRKDGAPALDRLTREQRTFIPIYDWWAVPTLRASSRQDFLHRHA
jgi:hypothetical protein